MTNQEKFEPQEKSTEIAIRFGKWISFLIGRDLLSVNSTGGNFYYLEKEDKFINNTEELFELWLNEEYNE